MTLRDLIRLALLDIGVINGARAPTAAEAADALAVFNEWVQGRFGFGAGDQLTDVVVTTSPYTANENERILWTGTGTLTVNLPATYSEGSITRPPRGGARVMVTAGGVTTQHVYISSRGQWVQLGNFTLDSVDPLGPDVNHWLRVILSDRLTAMFNVPKPDDLPRRVDEAERAIAARFRPDMTALIDPPLWSYWSRNPVWLS